LASDISKLAESMPSNLLPTKLKKKVVLGCSSSYQPTQEDIPRVNQLSKLNRQKLRDILSTLLGEPTGKTSSRKYDADKKQELIQLIVCIENEQRKQNTPATETIQPQSEVQGQTQTETQSEVQGQTQSEIQAQTELQTETQTQSYDENVIPPLSQLVVPTIEPVSKPIIITEMFPDIEQDEDSNKELPNDDVDSPEYNEYIFEQRI
jgi:hypothetical protein